MPHTWRENLRKTLLLLLTVAQQHHDNPPQMDHRQQQGHAPVTAITTLSPAPAPLACTPPEAGIRDIKKGPLSSLSRPNAKNPVDRHFKRVHGLGDLF